VFLGAAQTALPTAFNIYAHNAANSEAKPYAIANNPDGIGLALWSLQGKTKTAPIILNLNRGLLSQQVPKSPPSNCTILQFVPGDNKLPACLTPANLALDFYKKAMLSNVTWAVKPGCLGGKKVQLLDTVINETVSIKRKIATLIS
jgi:hypothetical protein